MPSLSYEQKTAIAIGVPVVALLLYLWYRKRQSTSKFQDEDEDARMEERENVASANQRTIEVKVPRLAVGAIIGKSGANIKKIEKDSGARINMKDEEESSENGERIVLIQGEREKAKRAEILVKKIIAEQPVIRTEEIFIPQRACGRIIGKGGQTIRNMSSLSGARIKIDRDNEDMSSSLRKCLITGTSDQIASAKGLLDEKIAEDNEIRARRGDTGMPRNRRAPRKLETAPASATGVVQFPKTDDFYGVFVSAIDNPGHFWVQLLTKDSPELDKLTNELTLMYSSSEMHAVLNAFKVGDICCAPFVYDSSWYRARILEINKDGMVELYYVDFGDSGQISKEKLRELKKEHNRLPFQAIECYLAGVKPSGEEWSKESTDDFDQLTHCAQWVSLMARVVKYSGDIPCLELIDTTGQTDVNINEEMIKKQFAVRDMSSPPEEQGQVSDLEYDAKGAGIGLQETPEVIKQNRGELQESTPPISRNRGTNGETEFVQKQNIGDVLSETVSKDFTDAPLSDVSDGNPAELHVAVAPEIDSPVKAALVKTISQDYIPIPAGSLPDMSAPDQGNVAILGVEKEQGIVDLKPDVATLDQTTSTKKKRRENEAVFESELNLQPKVPRMDLTNSRKHSAEEQLGGYRSSLNISPLSRRTMAASFSGTRHASERSENSVKNVTSSVRHQVVPSKQSYVNTVTIPDHSNNSNVIVSVTPSVTQLTEGSPFDLENHTFRASNESTTFTQHAVTSEVRRTVTQTNGSDTKTDFSASRLEKKLASHSSSADEKQTVTYEINFQGTPGTEPYTVKKKYTSLEDVPYTSGAFGEMSPSGSLLEISSNTVIDEEEEYEQEQVDEENGSSSKSARSESPEPDSDTESFMSAKEDMTSDTDTAAYMTAGGSSASLYTDAVSLVNSSAEEATTPVNSDTEVEEEEEGQGSGTPQAPDGEETGDRSRSNTLKGLREQTSILGSDVTSDGDLGYRGDSEEGLASTDDLRTAGT